MERFPGSGDIMTRRHVYPAIDRYDFPLQEAIELPTANQIFNAKIGAVDSTATINLGDTINVGPESNVKELGGSEPIGDFSLNITGGSNQFIDPDIIDQ